jgi:hypothetical protein
MENIEKIIIDEAINEVNLDLDHDDRISNSIDTLLLDANSSIDSLTLVRLLIAIERIIEEKTGKNVTVVDESAFETDTTPFASVGTLTAHVKKLLVEK